MRSILLAVTAVILTAGSTFASERAPDGVIADPDSHVVVFENEHVRVIENISSPGKASPMHSHNTMLIVSVDLARLKLTVPGQEPMIVDLRPGQVMWMENPEHAWELLAGQLHVIAIEVKSAAQAN